MAQVWCLKTWNTETGAEVHALGHSCSGVCICSMNEQGLLLNPECTVAGHAGPIHLVNFSPDGKLIASTAMDMVVKIWNTETGQEMFTITGHSSYVSCFAFSADGKRVVTGSFDNLVKIWDARTGAEVCTLTGHLDQVTCIALSRDGKRVVSGSCDGLVKVWDAATGAEMLSLGEHHGAGLCLCNLDENGNLFENQYTGEVMLHPTCPCTGHAGVSRVQFSDDGAQVVSGGDENTVRVWDVASGRRTLVLDGQEFALVEGKTLSLEGLSAEHTRGRHVLTTRGDKLYIYDCAKEEQHAGDGVHAGTAAGLVAYFKAPARIASVRCHGAAICLGGDDGVLCVLSAPFLAGPI